MIHDVITMLEKIKSGRKMRMYDFIGPRLQVDLARAVMNTIFLVSLVDEVAAGKMLRRMPRFTRALLDGRWSRLMAIALEIRDEFETSMRNIGTPVDIFFKEADYDRQNHQR